VLKTDAGANLTTFYYTFYITPYNFMDFMILNRPKSGVAEHKIYTLIHRLYILRRKAKTKHFLLKEEDNLWKE